MASVLVPYLSLFTLQSVQMLFLQHLQASLKDKIQTIAQVGAKVRGLLKLYISAMYHIEK